MTFDIDVSRRINGEFKILHSLGSGSFSEVRLVQDRRGKKKAAKFVPARDKDLVDAEINAMQKFENSRFYGTPYWYYSGRHGNCYVIVMDLLGRSIWKLHRHYRNLSFKSVLMVGIQLIRRVQKLHDRGYIHRDLKPDNFVVGRTGKDRGYVYLIDYGLAIKYKDRGNHHKPRSHTHGFYGTRLFSACASARFESQSRRSDLESLLYNLVYLMKGSLPWEEKSRSETLFAKERITAAELCAGLPGELKTFLQDVKALRFSERPDYSKLIRYLETALENAGYQVDNKFEWNH